MRTIDIKSFVIGVLASMLVVVGVAATASTYLTAGHYSVTTSAANGVVYVCFADTETGAFSLAQYLPNANPSRNTLPSLNIIGTFKNPLGSGDQAPEPDAGAQWGSSVTNMIGFTGARTNAVR